MQIFDDDSAIFDIKKKSKKMGLQDNTAELYRSQQIHNNSYDSLPNLRVDHSLAAPYNNKVFKNVPDQEPEVNKLERLLETPDDNKEPRAKVDQKDLDQRYIDAQERLQELQGQIRDQRNRLHGLPGNQSKWEEYNRR